MTDERVLDKVIIFHGTYCVNWLKYKNVKNSQAAQENRKRCLLSLKSFGDIPNKNKMVGHYSFTDIFQG